MYNWGLPPLACQKYQLQAANCGPAVVSHVAMKTRPDNVHVQLYKTCSTLAMIWSLVGTADTSGRAFLALLAMSLGFLVKSTSGVALHVHVIRLAICRYDELAGLQLALLDSPA